MSAELRLTAWPLEEHHHIARDDECEFAAEVLFDKREREVHAGSHASRRAQRAVANENLIVVDEQIRKVASQFVGTLPMRGDAASVEETGCCKEEHPCAHRTVAPDGRCAPAEPSRYRRINLVKGRIASHQERVDRLVRIIDSAVGEETETAGSTYSTRSSAHDLHFISSRIA